MEDRNYKIGNFTEKVIFLRPKEMETDTGSDISFEPFSTRLCEVQDNLEKSEMVSDALSSLQSYSIITWQVPGVTADWRIQYQGEEYYIDRILKEDRFISRYEIRKTDLS